MKKRYIFDEDGTLIKGDFKVADDYLKDQLGDVVIPFIENINGYLDLYERKYHQYNFEYLSDFLKEHTGLNFTPKIIREWNELAKGIPNTVEDGVIDLLEELKKNDKEIVVLTNWFTDSQVQRLKNTGLLDYIDTIYGGDIATKPHKQAYWIASAGRREGDCLFVGDHLENDYIGPKSCGFDSVLYDKNDVHHESIVKVKRMNEILKF